MSIRAISPAGFGSIGLSGAPLKSTSQLPSPPTGFRYVVDMARNPPAYEINSAGAYVIAPLN